MKRKTLILVLAIILALSWLFMNSRKTVNSPACAVNANAGNKYYSSSCEATQATCEATYNYDESASNSGWWAAENERVAAVGHVTAGLTGFPPPGVKYGISGKLSVNVWENVGGHSASASKSKRKSGSDSISLSVTTSYVLCQNNYCSYSLGGRFRASGKGWVNNPGWDSDYGVTISVHGYANGACKGGSNDDGGDGDDGGSPPPPPSSGTKLEVRSNVEGEDFGRYVEVLYPSRIYNGRLFYDDKEIKPPQTVSTDVNPGELNQTSLRFSATADSQISKEETNSMSWSTKRSIYSGGGGGSLTKPWMSTNRYSGLYRIRVKGSIAYWIGGYSTGYLRVYAYKNGVKRLLGQASKSYTSYYFGSRTVSLVVTNTGLSDENI